MITENLSTLKIHNLTKDQYQRELEAGRIDENAIYLTPFEETDLSSYATQEYVDSSLSTKQPAGDYALKADYDESIIGLSVDGQTITYIKGDGSIHTIVTQDTDTTYSIATDEVTGLTKLYATTGSAEDGTMTQKAIKTELDKKVGVSIDSVQDMLIFTI